MTLSLSNIKGNKTNKDRKRVGRGNASGHGTYSTRGLKGQKSRSGVSGLKRLGMRQRLLSIPKSRGFTSYHAKAKVITFNMLNKALTDGATVNPVILRRLNLLGLREKAKIVVKGDLKLKNLQIKDIQASEGAKAIIEKMGGNLS
ncbi:MAG: uL15 family ribosomal protein [Patescibacteria group bacterium]|nr:MAG: uL15 family ribosomal protein [Patescibacteria group bacterium]